MLGELRAQHAVEARGRRSSSSSTRVWIASIRSLGGCPSGPARIDARVELIEEPGNPDHEELVEVRGVDRAELHSLEERHVGVLGQFQHTLVEIQPGELAVEIKARIDDPAIVLAQAGASESCPRLGKSSTPPSQIHSVAIRIHHGGGIV